METGTTHAVHSTAERQRVVWARVKGYPPWPAQIMDNHAAKKWLKDVRRGKHSAVPRGSELGFKVTPKRDKRLAPSIEQAERYLRGIVHPSWWSQSVSDAGPGMQAAQQARPDEQNASDKWDRLQEGEEHVAKKMRTETQADITAPASLVPTGTAPAQLPLASSEGATAVQLGRQNEAAFLAPKRRPSTSTPGGQAQLEPSPGVPPPKYDLTRRNIWPASLSRPKRLPRDDIPTCDCYPFSTGSDDLPPLFCVPTQLERSSRARAAKVQEQGKMDCGADCVNRQSYVHCDAKTCPCGLQCTNKPFYLLPLPRLVVFHTGQRGWGVRAAERIAAGSFIVEYTGELLNVAVKQQRLQDQARLGIHDFYMMEHSPGIIIDARLKGNVARLINSSCDPNCETQKWRDAATNEGRIGIFAKREIQPGEELAYDYNFEHSGLAHQAGAYRCQCGAPTCRGTMDSRPDRLKDAYRRIEIFWEGDMRFYRGTVLGFHAPSGAHIICYDDGQRTREDLLAVRHRWLPDTAPLCPDGDSEESSPFLVPILRQADPAVKPEDTASAPERSSQTQVSSSRMPKLADWFTHIGWAGKPMQGDEADSPPQACSRQLSSTQAESEAKPFARSGLQEVLPRQQMANAANTAWKPNGSANSQETATAQPKDPTEPLEKHRGRMPGKACGAAVPTETGGASPCHLEEVPQLTQADLTRDTNLPLVQPHRVSRQPAGCQESDQGGTGGLLAAEPGLVVQLTVTRPESEQDPVKIVLDHSP